MSGRRHPSSIYSGANIRSPARTGTTYYAIFTDWKGKRKRGFRFSRRAASSGRIFDADKIKPDEGLASWSSSGSTYSSAEAPPADSASSGAGKRRQDGFRRHMANEQLSCLSL